MSVVDEQFEKLLYSIERFKEDIKKGDKRAAIGDMDFINDRAKRIIFLLLAQLESENKISDETEEYESILNKLVNEPNCHFDRGSLFNERKPVQ